MGIVHHLRRDAGGLALFAVVLNMGSRHVVGWATRHTPGRGLVFDALAMA